MSKETDIAWCAGFFDGEGHVSYQRITNPKTFHVTRSLFCSVPQKSDNREVLDFFIETIGFGTINGPYKHYNASGTITEMYNINFRTKEIPILFEMLKPYLKSQKTQAFQFALADYWMHEPKANNEDIDKLVKRNINKTLKNLFITNEDKE